MAPDRNAIRTAAVVERRPVAAAAVQRSAANAPSAARSLQQRLGNQGTQVLVARSIATPASEAAARPAVTDALAGATLQLAAAKVSSPHDHAEKEAEETARKVVRMPATEPPAQGAAKTPSATIQRDAIAAPASAPASVGLSGGAPLSAGVRSFMEPRFGASFANVRVHTGDAAAQQSTALNAHAFTVGEHVFFGRDKFQPESASGRELIAHELTHTIQQGSVVQRSADTEVAQRTPTQIQRLSLGGALDWIADKANYLPGFRLLTIVLGMNPVNLAPVDRSAANLLRALLELIPVTGALLAQALDGYGIFAKVGAWVEGKVKTLGLVGSALKGALDKFLNTLSWTDILSPGDVYERGKYIFTDPITRLIEFGKSLAADIIGFIRDAILLPLARLAEGTRGYDLLKAVLGQDPITGEKVPRNAETLIGGFMRFIGQEEVWENLKKSNAVARAWAWFQDALEGLLGFLRQIPALFVAALKSIELVDIILPVKAFLKVAGVFAGFAVQFVSWAGNAVWKLLEIIFEVVSPATLAYLRKTGAALKGILRDPLPFVHNLVRAAKLGLSNFADNFFAHLKAGLIEWLTGSLPGVYIPQSFALGEIVKFVFSVLGLTWQNVRPKLVKAVGETAVKAMEMGFDIVVTLVTEGPAAAWEKIQEHLANLKDQVINGIIDFVIGIVVKKAIPKLVSMFIPGAGFISAILSIYDTIMVFVNKLSKIAAVVTSFVDSIVDIASGAIDGAAKRVETTLAGLLSLAISFLAGFVGLGNVAEQVMGVITKIRAVVDKAVDALISWIVKVGKGLFEKGKAAVKAVFDWATSKRDFTDEEGHKHDVYVDASGATARLVIASTPQAAKAFVDFYVKKRGTDFKDANTAKIGDVNKAITAAEAQVGVIDKAKKAGKADDELVPMQQKLLDLNVAVCAALSTLIGKDESLGKLREKYLLEGLSGTYGAIPKPKGDSFTADHQPQAAILEAASALDYFTEAGEKRAAGRAQAGFAINLHFKRHTAGRTYGGKGGATKNKFLESVKDAIKGKKGAAQKKLVAAEIRKELKADVDAMKAVTAKRDNFQDIIDLKLPAKDEKDLIKEVKDRIDAGENLMAAQDIDSLVK